MDALGHDLLHNVGMVGGSATREHLAHPCDPIDN